jgi:hypothetical protein
MKRDNYYPSSFEIPFPCCIFIECQTRHSGLNHWAMLFTPEKYCIPDERMKPFIDPEEIWQTSMTLAS